MKRPFRMVLWIFSLRQLHGIWHVFIMYSAWFWSCRYLYRVLFAGVILSVAAGWAYGETLGKAYVRDVRIVAPEPVGVPEVAVDWEAPSRVEQRRNLIGNGLLVFYGCETCHALPVRRFGDRRGPDLDRIGEKTTGGWLAHWLADPRAFDSEAQMAQVPLAEGERADVIAFLMAQKGGDLPVPEGGNVEKGRMLFEAAQCRSCHRLAGAGRDVGPDLDRVGEKIRAPWLVAYLMDPKAVVSNTRMPGYEFSREQAEDLAAFLLGTVDMPMRGDAQAVGDVQAGLNTFVQKGCAGCHGIGQYYKSLGVPSEGAAGRFVRHHETVAPKLMLRDAQVRAMVEALIPGDEGDERVEPDVFLEQFWETPIPLQGWAPAAYDSAAADLHPESCGTCHADQFADWGTTLHRKGMGPGVMGQLLDDLGRSPGFATGCQACHAPAAEQHQMLPEGAGYEVNYRYDWTLQGAGITCAVCHVREHTRYGPAPGKKPAARVWRGPGHGGANVAPPFSESGFCAPCHQFEPDAFALNGRLLQNTHVEWAGSPQAAAGETCQSCHMPDRRHLWRGIHDVETVQDAVRVDVVGEASGPDSLVAEIRVVNAGAGHHLPTYVTPKLFVKTKLVDAQDRALKGTKAVRAIGREVVLGAESYEVFDTRIPAGGTWVWRYVVGRSERAVALAVDLEVHPDHFYLGFFEGYNRLGLSPEAASMIDSAEANARRSPYLLMEKRWGLADLPVDSGD